MGTRQPSTIEGKKKDKSRKFKIWISQIRDRKG